MSHLETILSLMNNTKSMRPITVSEMPAVLRMFRSSGRQPSFLFVGMSAWVPGQWVESGRRVRWSVGKKNSPMTHSMIARPFVSCTFESTADRPSCHSLHAPRGETYAARPRWSDHFPLMKPHSITRSISGTDQRTNLPTPSNRTAIPPRMEQTTIHSLTDYERPRT
jgi:hypothetical protein